MSLTEEYKELDKIRKKEAEEAAAHYAARNLPGDRTMNVDISSVKASIAAMAEEKAKPNHD